MATGRTHDITVGVPGPLLRAGRPVRQLAVRTVRAAQDGTVLAVGLATALALLLGVSGFFGYQLYQQHQEDERHQEVLAVARQMAVNFTSLNHKTYDRDSANVLKGATGDFKKEFAAKTKELTKLVDQNKSVSQGQVLEAGVARLDEKSARVLVVADSKVSNVAAPQGQARNYRLQLDLVYEGGRWLTSNVEFVG